MNKKYLLLITLCIFIYLGCDDIFEEDISEKKFNLYAPSDNITTTEVNQTFWWQEVEDATHYALQIVSPSFQSIEKLVLDSTVTENQFDYTLNEGTYQWRVKALNNISYTYSDTNTFIIESTDISGVNFDLLSPTNNLQSPDTVQSFSWENVTGATEYDLRIVSPSFSSMEELVVDTIINDQQISILLYNGSYEWRVKASNSISETISDTNTVVIDTTLTSKYDMFEPENHKLNILYG